MRTVHPLNPQYLWDTTSKVEKTEQEAKKEPNKEFEESNRNFWGIYDAPPPKVEEKKVEPHLKKSIDRFYCLSDRESPSEEMFSSRKKFYDDPTPRDRGNFQNLYNPGSIHRTRYKLVDPGAKKFKVDLNKFYHHEASTPDPSSYRFGLKRENIEIPGLGAKKESLGRSAKLVRTAKSLI